MSQLNLNVNVNIDLSSDTKEFISTFLSGFSKPVTSAPATSATKPVAGTTVGISAPVESATKPATSAPAAKPATAVPVTQAAKPATVAPAAKPAASSVTIEQIRDALKEKVNTHREEIKEKLSSLGAPSVSKLDEQFYEEMYNFLQNLG